MLEGPEVPTEDFDAKQQWILACLGRDLKAGRGALAQEQKNVEPGFGNSGRKNGKGYVILTTRYLDVGEVKMWAFSNRRMEDDPHQLGIFESVEMMVEEPRSGSGGWSE